MKMCFRWAIQLYHGFHGVYITEWKSFQFYSQDLCFPLTHTPLGKFAFSLQSFLPVFGAFGRSWSFFLGVSRTSKQSGYTQIEEAGEREREHREREEERECAADLISRMYFCFHIHSHGEERHTASSFHAIHSSTHTHTQYICIYIYIYIWKFSYLVAQKKVTPPVAVWK